MDMNEGIQKGIKEQGRELKNRDVIQGGKDGNYEIQRELKNKGMNE